MSTPLPTPVASENAYNPDLPWFSCVPLTAATVIEQPVRFSYAVDLPITSAQLFEVFEDPDSWPKWAIGIGRVVWTSPKPFGVGTTRTVIFWGGMEVYEEFTAWESDRNMAFTFLGTSQEVWTSFAENYDVEPTEGGCRLTWTVSYTPVGVFGRIHWLIAPLMRFNLGTYMWWLRRYCRKLG